MTATPAATTTLLSPHLRTLLRQVGLPEPTTPQEAAALTERLRYTWPAWARPNQLPPPGNWQTWLLLAGRGFGKTRSGAEWVRHLIETDQAGRVAIVAPTNFDARVTMIEGESGIVNICPPWNKPTYHPSKSEVRWQNGAVATIFSAEEPDRLNGPQFHAAWCDELGVWDQARKTWDMLAFGLRLGQNPQCVVTTTPKPAEDKPEARDIIKELLADPDTVTSTGSTYDNIAHLAPSYIKNIVKKYEGTRLGREQLHAQMIDEVQGALWHTSTMLDPYRIRTERGDTVPDLVRVAVGVDPMTKVLKDDERERATKTGRMPVGSETGIVAGGVDERGHAYVLADHSLMGTPDQWGRAVIRAYSSLTADRVVAEINQGGAMVESTIRTIDPAVSYKAVHAHQGKYARAEPIAALYEQGKVHHVGVFDRLEGEMTTWVPGALSPNRLDALVWLLTELMIEGYRPKPQILY